MSSIILTKKVNNFTANLGDPAYSNSRTKDKTNHHQNKLFHIVAFLLLLKKNTADQDRRKSRGFFCFDENPIENSPVLSKLRSPLILPARGKASHMPKAHLVLVSTLLIEKTLYHKTVCVLSGTECCHLTLTASTGDIGCPGYIILTSVTTPICPLLCSTRSPTFIINTPKRKKIAAISDGDHTRTTTAKQATTSQSWSKRYRPSKDQACNHCNRKTSNRIPHTKTNQSRETWGVRKTQTDQDARCYTVLLCHSTRQDRIACKINPTTEPCLQRWCKGNATLAFLLGFARNS